MDTEEALSALADRIVKMDIELKRLRHDLSDESEARQAGDQEAGAQVRALVDRQGEEQRKRTMRGLRWEAWGFFVVTVGAIMQGAGSVVGAWSSPPVP